MKFKLDGLDVYFPYDKIYPEQYEYMRELYSSLRKGGHCLLEMPSGTGKTISLLSLITSYQLTEEGKTRKLIYCTRTVPEMEKVLEELNSLIEYRSKHVNAPIIGIGLSSRKNLCIHPKSQAFLHDGSHVDSICRSLTAGWLRAEAKEKVDSSNGAVTPTVVNNGTTVLVEDIELCNYYERFIESAPTDTILPNGVYTMRDLKIFGKKKGWCPYFLSRRAIEYANVVVYSYSYLLDPKISSIISKNIPSNSIVVFDEAHNIDNVCIEALSINIDRDVIGIARNNLTKLEENISQMEKVNSQRLQEEYRRLVDGLGATGVGRVSNLSTLSSDDEFLSNPVLPSDIMKEAVPGNIRKANHFVKFMKRFTTHVNKRLQTQKSINETPEQFLNNLAESMEIDARSLRFCSERLVSLMNTLEIKNIYDFNGIRIIMDFATLIGTYQEGFIIIIEPYDPRTPTNPDPILQFSCMDASLAISKPVFNRFQTVVLTSGTLSPLEMYPKLLKFKPVISKSLEMTLTRECICPLVMTRGSDQVAVTTKYRFRNDASVQRNYGNLILELSKYVPDGIVCFFTSYQYMEDIVSFWNSVGILNSITNHKLVFIETPNTAETAIALDNYRKACDCGRGAIFFSIARGKVAEGIDFDGHYGRCVVMIGVPFQNTESKILKARLNYLRQNFSIKEENFLTFDALRHASQCIGRVIRNKADYGIMILADKRYNQPDKRNKLPRWIAKQIKDSYLNLSTDAIIGIARKYLKEMAQPYSATNQLLGPEEIEQLSKKRTIEQLESTPQNTLTQQPPTKK
ncbi:hypothetical protein FDP41_002355 [Naegleria fowleri]|uniref:DNA 5'-3' helicase n=1 Tax=Naegleria fowleri TaxID=5763 RepID=A0A6A5BYW7_NAEFO|nr:uncharacterized protein FDP41_002355 [Naegleria fowleri]KAF0978535.1 hypothetical protein FDP41_002355 [Naegleria fowleri]CAG4710335.1 unnamed protein product [Naegleria fowleri]